MRHRHRPNSPRCPPSSGRGCRWCAGWSCTRRAMQSSTGASSGCLGQFVELFHWKIILDHVLGLDLFEEVVDVGADQPVTVEDFQKSPKCRPVSRCGVSCNASVTLEFLCRQQVLTELVAEINVELLKSTLPFPYFDFTLMNVYMNTGIK